VKSRAADNESHAADNESHAADNKSHAADDKSHAADDESHAADEPKIEENGKKRITNKQICPDFSTRIIYLSRWTVD